MCSPILSLKVIKLFLLNNLNGKVLTYKSNVYKNLRLLLLFVIIIIIIYYKDTFVTIYTRWRFILFIDAVSL